MMQGPKHLALGTALLLAAAVGLSTMATAAQAAPKAAAQAAQGSKARHAMRQFTGYVTALDKSTLTVERRGKNSRAIVFTKHDAMKTTGDIEKDARVTVYYRDEGGRSVAHRVIVKGERRTGT